MTTQIEIERNTLKELEAKAREADRLLDTNAFMYYMRRIEEAKQRIRKLTNA